MSHPDRPGEACGVFGVYAPGQRASNLIYFGLFALQHRGQESAGIASSDGATLTVYKDLGLVAQVFDETSLAALDGHVGIGHTRYSTTGSTTWENSQPVHRQVGAQSIALGHNGNLTNSAQLAERLGWTRPATDSELMAEAVAQAIRPDQPTEGALEAALLAILPAFEGAFSLVVMDQDHLVGVRDAFGFRPLSIGRLPGGGWVLASETAALDLVGATYERDVETGEMVIIDSGGIRSLYPFEQVEPRLCIFEFVYFARPDSLLAGRSVHAARREMGRLLADEHPANVDVVVPVPESGIPAAQGYAAASGVPYADGLVKNRYIGRTFIEPSHRLRERGIKLKLNPISSTLSGQRVLLVDDSIVRGSTTRQLVSMVRDAGAREVHLRISSPPYRWPCFYGMDTSDSTQLLAGSRDVDEIATYLGADSLGYLSVEGLEKATGGGGFCTACLTGLYPTDVSGAGDKNALERLR